MKNIILMIFGILFLFSTVRAADDIGKLILLQNSTSAACLDGSPTGYYYFQGSGSGSNKYLIYLQGGGKCEGETREQYLESCYQRSKTSLGSSKKWSKNLSNTGNLSNNEQKNPAFHDWNKIFINYCDGSLYQGSAKAIPYKETSIYFRGYDNIVAIFDDIINKYDIQSSEMVVLSGGSAGGLGAFYWNQYLRRVINSSVTVLAAPDSGLFVAIPGVDEPSASIITDLITDGNRSIIQPQGCPFINDNQNVYKCTYPQFLIDLIPVPLFVINSLYDSYTIANILKVSCMTNKFALQNCNSDDQAKIDLLHSLTLTQLNIIQQNKPNWGAWAISCLYHVFSEKQLTYNGATYEVPQNSDLTVSFALNRFINSFLGGGNGNINNFHIDQQPYPLNRNCNGIQQKQFLKSN